MVFGVCAERKHSLRRNIPLQFFDTDGLDELCPACDVVLDEFPKLRCGGGSMPAAINRFCNSGRCTTLIRIMV